MLALIAYFRTAHPRRQWLLWIGVAVITAAWYNNIAGPPPAGAAQASGAASLIFFLVISAWAYCLK
jgi:type II secretory pathway component PulM